MKELQNLLSSVYDDLQKIVMPATSENINTVIDCMHMLKKAYALTKNAQEQGGAGDGMAVSDNG